MTLPNVQLHYLYRDSSNYKLHGTVVFANPNHMQATAIWRKLIAAVNNVTLISDMPLFRPEWVGLPTVFLFEKLGFTRNSDDHDWHELMGVEETDAACTSCSELTIEAFIRKLARTHKKPN